MKKIINWIVSFFGWSYVRIKYIDCIDITGFSFSCSIGEFKKGSHSMSANGKINSWHYEWKFIKKDKKK